MNKLYRISKKNEADKYCSETKTDPIYYLLKDNENGKTLKELATVPYMVVEMLVNYESLQNILERNENKK